MKLFKGYKPMNLGEQIRQKYFEMIDSNFVFKGCTDMEIDKVKEFQNITYIPQSYRELLQVMGHRGLSRIAMGESDWNLLEKVKADFIGMMQLHRMSYPSDLLVFYNELETFYFCRTRDRIDNPTVYGYSNGWIVEGAVQPGMAKLAERLSDYWLMLIDAYRNLTEGGIGNWKPLAQIYYDSDLDEYLIDGQAYSK